MKTQIFILFIFFMLSSCSEAGKESVGHRYNDWYFGSNLDRMAFPVGGIGAGMFCIEGTGAISHMSVRNRPEVFNEPCMFAALSVEGIENGTKVLEGPVPGWKIFGRAGTDNAASGSSYGLPRFQNARFLARFPFATIVLQDDDMPLDVGLTAWSPFIPTDADNSSLPAGAIEYQFTNTGKKAIKTVFSFSSKNFLAQRGGVNSIKPITGGFILSEEGTKERPWAKGDFAIFTDDPAAVVDYCWFRGGW